MTTRVAFINEVVDDITEGKTIPVSPNESRINGIIDRALKFFKEKSDDGVEFEYIILKSEAFSTDLFRAKRQVQLPECVESITNVRKLGNVLGGGNGEIYKDYRKSNFNAAVLAGGGKSQDMLTAVTQQFYNDFLNNFQLRTVGYEYNSHTHMLTIIGMDPRESMIADAYVHVPDEAFFNMDMFFRYVVGKCKESFASSFSFIKQKTIGGREINVSEIRSDGKEMIKEVKQEIKDQENSVDFWTEY
jgi:hypothetical protein